MGWKQDIGLVICSRQKRKSRAEQSRAEQSKAMTTTKLHLCSTNCVFCCQLLRLNVFSSDAVVRATASAAVSLTCLPDCPRFGAHKGRQNNKLNSQLDHISDGSAREKEKGRRRERGKQGDTPDRDHLESIISLAIQTTRTQLG